MPNIFGLILTCVIVVIVFSLLLFLIKRYKKCPSDKVMVIYGKVGSNKDGSTRSAKCIHGGAAFIWPVIQSYEFLDLTPMSISVDLENALSRQSILGGAVLCHNALGGPSHDSQLARKKRQILCRAHAYDSGQKKADLGLHRSVSNRK